MTAGLPQHFLYFTPDAHGQGSFGFVFTPPMFWFAFPGISTSPPLALCACTCFFFVGFAPLYGIAAACCFTTLSAASSSGPSPQGVSAQLATAAREHHVGCLYRLLHGWCSSSKLFEAPHGLPSQAAKETDGKVR